MAFMPCNRHSNFYPRPPRGGRPLGYMSLAGWDVFLSTPSARRATRHKRGIQADFGISIHALREEGDALMRPARTTEMTFLSTPSARRATGGFGVGCRLQIISIHALREEGDRHRKGHQSQRADFYPRPPRGGRPPGVCAAGDFWRYFYPRPPRGGRHVLAFVKNTRLNISIHALREEGDTT